MEELLYQMIFKRKSFHLFEKDNEEKISLEELKNIESIFFKLKPLMEDIKVELRIAPAYETSCNRGEEYCLLFYSENKDNYLQNIGYLGEQLDLYLTSMNIGTLWFGIGTPKEMVYHNLDYVIMIAIAKVSKDKFRKDMSKSKRKSLAEIWSGDYYQNIGDIVRFAPSACNTQPWFIKSMANKLDVYRYKKPGKRGIMPINQVIYYNRIDMGIFLLFLDICLKHEHISYKRTLFIDKATEEIRTLTASYDLEKMEDYYEEKY